MVRNCSTGYALAFLALASMGVIVGEAHTIRDIPMKSSENITVTTVHIINSCHLDIGFADSSVGIINRYFDHHIPLAVTLGKEFRNSSIEEDKLNFMFQSWVVSMYLDCPPGMGLHCPSPTQIADFESAVNARDITWHAFPHNAELEMMSPALIEAGLALTWELDDRFKMPRKKLLSQRDVPGMTRALVPILSNAGVNAISIGANDGSTPPSVPNVFEWVDTASNTSILGLFNWPGYGNMHNSPVVVPGSSHALMYNWNGDNAGPLSAAAYAASIATAKKAFPNADVYFSTFDNFTQHILPLLGKGVLPVVSAEMGDTWVYGCPSDPQKVARMRVFNRAWTTAATQRPSGSFLDEHLLRDDPVLKNATRFALKLGEHTWGRDVKSNLIDNDDWRNTDFHRAKTPPAKTAPQFQILEESWWEQREWGVTLALDTLNNGDHPLAEPLLKAIADLQPQVPDVTVDGFTPAQPGTRYTCGAGGNAVDIAFDSTGAVTRLGQSWVDEPGSALLKLVYRTYSATDVASFFAQYCKSTAGWVQHDYGKPGLPADVQGNNWSTALVGLWTKPADASTGDAGNCDFVAQLAFDEKTVTDFGAPAKVWLNVSVLPGVGGTFSVQTQIGLFNKTQTRLPEAMFVQFTAPQEQRHGRWSANKLGEWISSTEIVDGGTKHLHGVTDMGLLFEAPGEPAPAATKLKSFSVASMDAGVVNFGALTAYPSPVHNDANTTGHGSSFVLWDNLWGTNYVMWWPFQQPPPPQYAASSKYFPADWNSHMTFRYTLNVTEN
eukprot:m.1150901 g.1150901  ORF g.1150901 m.1150901 type:complete len:780 (+) comp24479_c0_seq2:116-2455(+)